MHFDMLDSWNGEFIMGTVLMHIHFATHESAECVKSEVNVNMKTYSMI